MYVSRSFPSLSVYFEVERVVTLLICKTLNTSFKKYKYYPIESHSIWAFILPALLVIKLTPAS